MENFSVNKRNPGHWDIYGNKGRLFRIRGGPGRYVVFDERKEENKEAQYFKTVSGCMVYICDILMWELIVAEGQTPTTIESWQVRD